MKLQFLPAYDRVEERPEMLGCCEGLLEGVQQSVAPAAAFCSHSTPQQQPGGGCQPFSILSQDDKQDEEQLSSVNSKRL